VASSSVAVNGCRGCGIRGKDAAEEQDVGLRGMNFLGCYQEKCQIHHGDMIGGYDGNMMWGTYN